ncbi:hypothetical protein [Streptomyces sp. NPDC052292]|uniref:hypothetical protein n=1 Tax=Streptomyces sp. NPDC052292 TaxID=3155053 RepID=UPI0034357B9B
MKVSERADVVVLGPGRGGEHATGTLAEAGPEAVGAGAEPVGGECPYRGGVPGRMTVRAGRAVLIGATSAGWAGGEVLCGLNVTSAGPAGGEVLYRMNVAVHATAPVERLRRTIRACPAFHRTVGAAPGALR